MVLGSALHFSSELVKNDINKKLIIRNKLILKLTMSKHTSKYYQLIKVLRAEKQMLTVKKTLREERAQMKTEVSKRILDQEYIAQIIDGDNTFERNREDTRITKIQSQLVLPQESYLRLWTQFKQKSLTINQRKQLLPVQKKINQMKDQAELQGILQAAGRQNEVQQQKISHLSSMLSALWQETIQEKKMMDGLQLQLNEYQKQFLKLKDDFDHEQKKINERSNKFREQKSKDNMIKNINRQDLQMRNAMLSRIKLNQELDFSFQLQRRRAFNQQKSTINEKKKVVQDKFNQHKLAYEAHLKKEEELEKERSKVKEQNKVLKNQIIELLKKTIKYFHYHSKGIKWIVERLTDMKVHLKKEEFPEEMANQDKLFLQEFLRQNVDPSPKAFARTQFKLKGERSNLNTPDTFSRAKKMYSLKTQPNISNNFRQFQFFTDKATSPTSRLKKKTTVYFDIDSQQGEWPKQAANQPDSSKFYIPSNSLKKVYDHAGEVISHLIKKKQWNYESCKMMSTATDQESRRSCYDDGSLKQKLKLKFMNVRQNSRRNKLKSFIFGEESAQ